MSKKHRQDEKVKQQERKEKQEHRRIEGVEEEDISSGNPQQRRGGQEPYRGQEQHRGTEKQEKERGKFRR